MVVNAFTSVQLDRAGVSSINDLARLTPQLKTFTNIGVNGGFSAIRGITSPSGNASTDPAVLVVINNVPVGTGGAMVLGQFDLGQAEILKGPQALFFGKNATAGIISLTTAEPTREFDAMLRGKYTKWRLAKSSLKGSCRVRWAIHCASLAVKYSHMDGEFTNGVTTAHQQRGPNTKEVGVRATLIYDPAPNFTMKLKGTYSRITDGGPFVNLQRMYCPSGKPAGASVTAAETDCSLDGHYWRIGEVPSTRGPHPTTTSSRTMASPTTKCGSGCFRWIPPTSPLTVSR